MSNSLVIIFLTLFVTQGLHAQDIGFEYKNAQFQAQSSVFCLQNYESHYIFTSAIYTDTSYSPVKTKIFELDENGDLLNEKYFEIENNDFVIGSLIERPNYYIGIGAIRRLDSDSNFIWFAHIDFDLNIVEEQVIYMNNSLMAGNDCLLIENEVYCVGYSFTTPSFGIRLSIDGEVLAYNNIGGGLYNSMIKKDSSTLLLYGKKLLEVDKDFNILEVLDPSPFDLDPQGYILNHTDSTYILCGRDSDFNTGEREIGVGISNFEYDEITYKTFGESGDAVDYPAFYKSIGKNNFGQIYSGGTLNFTSDSSRYVLSQFDASLNQLWQNQYPLSIKGFMNGLIPTSDNGCLMYGDVFETIGGLPHRVLYILKVDTNGDIILETSIPLEAPTVEVYPNPAADYINIEFLLLTTNTRIEIRKINGALIYSDELKDSLTQIDLRDFPNGAYLILLKDNNGKLIGNKKFVKQEQ